MNLATGNNTAQTTTKQMGKAIDDMTNSVRRTKFERRWYDNNFFDDGYHFRVVSKKTGRVMDTIEKSKSPTERAIPRASRQIRGVANLLFAAEPTPVVYPELIQKYIQNPAGGFTPDPEFQQKYDTAKQTAKRKGQFLTTTWDEQDIMLKLIEMVIIASKTSVSYMKVWNDIDGLRTETRDAFDLYLHGEYKKLKDCPFVIEGLPQRISEIKANDMFDQKMTDKLSPDNKYASSEIKDAYMTARFGSRENPDDPTVLLKEAFVPERLTETNWKMASKFEEAMAGKSKGDSIMRHAFSAGGICLLDEYVNLSKYPYADFRFEPGPLYQTPFIERFIPMNKSVDIIVTRLEKWINSQVIGAFMQRNKENFQITNQAGAQLIKYDTTPPTQLQPSSVGSTPFNVIELLNSFIEEQGASTAALNQLPPNIKSGVAIESLKATEYANLKIPTLMLKETIKTISELILEVIDNNIMNPTQINYLDKGNPDYFPVIGEKGAKAYQSIGMPLPPDVVTVRKTDRVRIEAEPGLGLTMQGKKEAMQQIVEYMIQLSTAGYLTQEAVALVVKQFMDVFGFGATQEFMDALETGTPINGVNEEDIQKIKVAMLETMKDTGAVGEEHDQKLIDSTKIGVVEALRDISKPKQQTQQVQN